MPMLAFQIIMIVTFLGAVISLFSGLFGFGSTPGGQGKRANMFMLARVIFSVALLLEIIIYLIIKS